MMNHPDKKMQKKADKRRPRGGPEGIRTLDLRDANAALSQLSYRPTGYVCLSFHFPIIAHFLCFAKGFSLHAEIYLPPGE